GKVVININSKSDKDHTETRIKFNSLNEKVPVEFEINDLVLQNGKEANIDWAPKLSDLTVYLKEEDSKFELLKDSINGLVTTKELDDQGKIITDLATAVNMLAGGIDINVKENGNATDIIVDPRNVKIRTEVLDIKGDVYIDNGELKVKKAIIEDITSNALSTTSLTLKDDFKIESEDKLIKIDKNEFMMRSKYDAGKYVKIDPDNGLTITKGGISIERTDGSKWTENGALVYDMAVTSPTPAFTSKELYLVKENPSFLGTTHGKDYRIMNYYRFKH